MKKYYILLIALIAITFSSCEKLLDKEPTDKLSLEDLFKDVSGVKTALAGAYHGLLEESHYQKNLMVYPDILGGNIKFSKTTNLRLDDVYNVVQNAQESTMNDTYAYLYSELNNVNNIIKYTPTAVGSSIEKDKIMAEAKCIRALIHFDLVRIFARPFNFTPDAGHLGVPIVLQPQLFGDPLPVRATVAQNYQAIVADLVSALTVFDNTNNGLLKGGYKQNYFTKTSAMAFLAKVYLNQNNWEMAFQTADEVIKSNSYNLLTNANYVNSWIGSVPSTESIFELPLESIFSSTGLGGYYDVNNNSNYRMFAATNDLLSIYSTTDIRNNTNMYNAIAISGNNFLFTKKYANGGTLSTPIKVLRLSELYLTRAEAATEKATPDYTIANADLNLIRKRGDLTANTINLTDKLALIDAILLERRKELAFEGNLLFDLLRKKKDVVRTDATSTVNNLTTNDNRLIMPFPAKTINANNKMIQNPGY